MSSESLLWRSFLARYPRTNMNASMTLDLPLPLGPTMAVKLAWKGPMTWRPA